MMDSNRRGGVSPPQAGGTGALRRTLTVAVAVLAAPAAVMAFPWPSPAKVSPECVKRVNQAALQAMNRTNPLGQMQIYGDPAVFDRRLLRVTVNVYGARTEIYAVDLTIDDACNVLSASTRLESNDWPYR